MIYVYVYGIYIYMQIHKQQFDNSMISWYKNFIIVILFLLLLRLLLYNNNFPRPYRLLQRYYINFLFRVNFRGYVIFGGVFRINIIIVLIFHLFRKVLSSSEAFEGQISTGCLLNYYADSKKDEKFQKQ